MMLISSLLRALFLGAFLGLPPTLLAIRPLKLRLFQHPMSPVSFVFLLICRLCTAMRTRQFTTMHTDH